MENAHWAGPSPLFAHRARPTPLKCKNEYPVLLWGRKPVQAVRLYCLGVSQAQKTKVSGDERGYLLYSVRLQLSFPSYAFGPIMTMIHQTLFDHHTHPLMGSLYLCTGAKIHAAAVK